MTYLVNGLCMYVARGAELGGMRLPLGERLHEPSHLVR